MGKGSHPYGANTEATSTEVPTAQERVGGDGAGLRHRTEVKRSLQSSQARKSHSLCIGRSNNTRQLTSRTVLANRPAHELKANSKGQSTCKANVLLKLSEKAKEILMSRGVRIYWQMARRTDFREVLSVGTEACKVLDQNVVCSKQLGRALKYPRRYVKDKPTAVEVGIPN